jgi:hypothetical protein
MTVNAYFRSKGTPEGATVHKLRHARATLIMRRQLDDPKECPFFRRSAGKMVVNMAKRPDQKMAEEWYKKAATQVGMELGHSAGEKVTWNTAVQAYINPSTTLNFFKDLSLRTPSWASKFED